MLLMVQNTFKFMYIFSLDNNGYISANSAVAKSTFLARPFKAKSVEVEVPFLIFCQKYCTERFM